MPGETRRVSPGLQVELVDLVERDCPARARSGTRASSRPARSSPPPPACPRRSVVCARVMKALSPGSAALATPIGSVAAISRDASDCLGNDTWGWKGGRAERAAIICSDDRSLARERGTLADARRLSRRSSLVASPRRARAAHLLRFGLALGSTLLAPATGARAQESLDTSAAAPADRRCEVVVTLEPRTGRIEGEATFTLSDAERFLTREGALPIALDSRLTLDRAAIERDGRRRDRRDPQGNHRRATDGKRGADELDDCRPEGEGAPTCLAPLVGHPARRRAGGRSAGAHPQHAHARPHRRGRHLPRARSRLAPGARRRSVHRLDHTRSAAVSVDARRHVAVSSRGQRRPRRHPGRGRGERRADPRRRPGRSRATGGHRFRNPRSPSPAVRSSRSTASTAR